MSTEPKTPLLDLVRRSRAAASLGDASYVWLAPPEWTGAHESAGEGAYPPPGRGYDRDTGAAVHGYAIGQLGIDQNAVFPIDA